jgi:hypothetical protein
VRTASHDHESVNGGSRADIGEDFHRPREPGALPNNLPDPLTSFVGREREVEEVREALAITRLLTLTGAGGCGNPPGAAGGRQG